MPLLDLLRNPLWHTLAGRHRHFSTGTDTARRYVRGYSPILGFADPLRPDFDALLPFCDAGERFWCEGQPGAPVPRGWRVVMERRMIRMVRDTAPPLPPFTDGGGIVRLDASHAQRAVDLAELTKPGPFGLRTFDYGEYWGVLDGDRLVAMAGERFEIPGLREVSGVCTHPDWRGRGLAKRLTLKLLDIVQSRGEIPFLQVADGNDAAHALYLGLGFRDHGRPEFRIVERIGEE
jgi:ribosomal protein S18 acetylase RimI-like enzyme